VAAVALGNAKEAVAAAGGGLPRAARVPNQWPTKTPKAKTKAKQQHVPKMTTIMLLVCGGLGKKDAGACLCVCCCSVCVFSVVCFDFC